ncbi:DUF4435 domain-containing protein [Pseudoduganella sp. R-43]|uniref:DUF4435 domain-containing protein n=1 Tax=Pseudoduganella sp. R-43 TaxID=3404063 RepID=UPI003CF4D16E
MQSKSTVMAQSKDRLSVSLLRYNKLRSKVPDAEIAIVEGADDTIFYSSIFTRKNLNSPEIFFQANGKDNVLRLRDVISRSKEIPKGQGNVFFIDSDYDGLKGYQPGEDIYVTPTYSIENLLVSKEALRRLMNAEFGLGTAELIDDRTRIIALFDEFLEQHANELKEVNRLLHCVRKESLAGISLTAGSIDENSEKFATVDANSLRIIKKASGQALFDLLKVKEDVPAEHVGRYDEDFLKLNPSLNWRGKFLFFLFRRFIAVLIEDRNSAQPKFFTVGKGKISFDTKQDSLVRILSSTCNIPECLDKFVESIREGRHKVHIGPEALRL